MATRRLRHAVLASLLAHLLILWSARVGVLTQDTPEVLLQATLRRAPPPAAAAAPAALRRAVPPAPTVAPGPTRAAGSSAAPTARPAPPEPQSPAPERPAAVSPARSPAPAAEAQAKRPPAAEAAVLQAETGAAPAGAAERLGGLVAKGARTAAGAADDLRGYRLALAVQARRFKRYPAQAMASGWEGRAEVRVEVGGDGQPRAATLVRSSGHEPLDRAALAMLDAAALRAPVPETLRGRAFAVVLPVVFNLNDE